MTEMKPDSESMHRVRKKKNFPIKFDIFLTAIVECINE